MTRKSMPSAAQRKILEALADGHTLNPLVTFWLMKKEGAGTWDRGAHISSVSCRAMRRAGWIVSDTTSTGLHRITNLGRHALEQAQASAPAAANVNAAE